MNKLKELSKEDLAKISDFAVLTAENFIFSRVSKKEIVDIDINTHLSYEDELDVDIQINLILDELCPADEGIADAAIEHTLKELDKFLDDNYRD
ncbi:MAG: DUF3194 domain-containing protein [Methanomicrobiales archaeon]